jgi:hypothetical protein
MVDMSLLRHFIEDARQHAAFLPMSDPEHAFYVGVVAAGEDRLRLQGAEGHNDEWLARQSPAFRDGYLKACHVIGSTGSGATRLVVPAPSIDA